VIDEAPPGAVRIGGKIPSKPPGSVRPPAARGRLVLENVCKAYGPEEMSAVGPIDLACECGEFVVVVGPSGCGKTTLLNLAAGMVRPDRGAIHVDGRAVHGPGPERAMVFQEHGLFPWLTAAENVEFGLKMAGVGRDERRDRVATALRWVRLSAAGNKLVHELSGGMRQRIAIARALVVDPAVLLMDEPFASLDAQTRTHLHEELQDLWCATNKTILFVTHSVGEAVRLADRVIVLHANPGRIRREIPIDLSHPRNFDGTQVSELVHLVRTEIEEEVNRVVRERQNPEDRGAASKRLARHRGRMGGDV
jgi:NitT/TauT family transport system ATP-binding protein